MQGSRGLLRYTRFVPAVALLAVVAAFLLFPEQKEVSATPAQWGFCNVSFVAIPEGVELLLTPYPRPLAEKLGIEIGLVARVSPPLGQPLKSDPEKGYWVPNASAVTIDPKTGEIVSKYYLRPDDEAKLEAVLAAMRVGLWEPIGAAWPRTEMSSTAAKKRVPWVEGSHVLQYREPEEGSGMLASVNVLETGPRGTYRGELEARTCYSRAALHIPTGEVLERDVSPQEEVMFQRFMAQVSAE